MASRGSPSRSAGSIIPSGSDAKTRQSWQVVPSQFRRMITRTGLAGPPQTFTYGSIPSARIRALHVRPWLTHRSKSPSAARPIAATSPRADSVDRLDLVQRQGDENTLLNHVDRYDHSRGRLEIVDDAFDAMQRPTGDAHTRAFDQGRRI